MAEWEVARVVRVAVGTCRGRLAGLCAWARVPADHASGGLGEAEARGGTRHTRASVTE